MNNRLKSFFEKNIKTVDWYNFCYTWFLTSLYHDIAFCIEEKEWNNDDPSDLEFYIRKYDIKHNVYDHKLKANSNDLNIYSENLVEKYFRYRKESYKKEKSNGRIDHGIIGGYLLYDKLIKNYDNTWSVCQQSNSNVDYDNFIYKDFSWRKEHKYHFAIIADAIIAHNIFHADTEHAHLYEKYGLHDLISTNRKPLNANDNTLVFFLGLLDTIEPIKRLGAECLEYIDIQLINNNSGISIELSSEKTEYLKWFSSISDKKTWSWLDVRVNVCKPGKKITIHVQGTSE